MNKQTQNIHVEKSLSDDKQYQERLAAEIHIRVANQSQDAWMEYLRTHRNGYPDYTIEQLAKSGSEWRSRWIIETLCEEMARVTATLVDLLGIATDLRALSRAKNPQEFEDIIANFMRHPASKKQAG